ncbi:MAG: molybdopterin biosynthesis protein, partial [Chloroflexota bacterium]
DAAGNNAKDGRAPHSIRIRSSSPPWQHVRPMGEDMVATQLVLPFGHQLRPVDLGAIAGCGHAEIYVARMPKIAVLPTGSELTKIGQPVLPGDIIEYNSLVLGTQIISWGGAVTRFPITPDEFEKISRQVSKAAQDHDLVLLNAGSSAGAEDFSARVVEELGELLVHGVAVRPGHPVIVGMLHGAGGKQTPIIGVPGYPVSAAITGELFVEPLIKDWLGKAYFPKEEIKAELTRKVTSPGGDDDFMRVVVGKVGEKMLAAPLSRGAGVITSLVNADGLVLLPSGTQGLPAGEKVNVQLYRHPAEIKNTIFSIGSHDMTLDLIAQFLTKHNRRLVSANVGSVGGLVALKRKESHIAGAHLLDPDTGEYNLPYIHQYLPGESVNVIGLVNREQGLIVPKGNPKQINTVQDLTREDLTFINRQRGAGTRILLDYHLVKENIKSGEISGYTEEEYTHLTLAAAVASGRADCGLGIAAAADALELDFIPLFTEQYDLIIPKEYVESELLAPLFEVLASEELKNAILQLSGYAIASIGTLIASVE